jgi:hypothetical protein
VVGCDDKAEEAGLTGDAPSWQKACCRLDDRPSGAKRVRQQSQPAFAWTRLNSSPTHQIVERIEGGVN